MNTEVRLDVGSQSESGYRHKDRYLDGAAVLPDILYNLLNGCLERQSYELYSKGSRQGSINFKVVDPETFKLEKSVSGSFVSSEMTPLFWKFVSIPNLKTAFNVKDKNARFCIQEIFTSVIKGAVNGRVSLGDKEEVVFQCTGYNFSCYLDAKHASVHAKSYEIVEAFFEGFDGSQFQGQLK